MRKFIAAIAIAGLMVVPATASASQGGAYGKTWQDATGCTYGEIVRMVKGAEGHPSINGLGAKNALFAALAAIEAGHPVPVCD